MTLNTRETSLPGVLLIEPRVFEDPRGFFLETYHRQKYAAEGMDFAFVQDNLSYSKRGTLRGLHYQLQHPQGKIIHAISGEIYDVAVDIRRGSPTFGQWAGFILSDKSKRQAFIPPGFAHGFYVLSETAHVLYKCTDVYHPEDEYGVLWSDPGLDIQWPVPKNSPPSLSEKDEKYPPLRKVPESCLPVY